MKRTAIALLTAGLVLAGSLAGYAADPRTLTVTGTGLRIDTEQRRITVYGRVRALLPAARR